MNACVGAARSNHADGHGGYIGERCFQCLLNGGLLDLTLPSAEGGAAVFEAQCPALSVALGNVRHY